jgi:O-antigen/teichoic acid export membrane protein
VANPLNIPGPDYPLLVFVLSFVALLLAVTIGDALRKRLHHSREDGRDDFGIVLTGTLTLLALIIGFSFSMAISRYDLPKSFEQAEANAIATEYSRADLLPAGGRNEGE